VQVVWTRIIFPDGSSINLDGMSGHDGEGRSGFHDQVNNHYARLVGFAVLTSAFAAGLELSQRQNTSLLTTTSFSPWETEFVKIGKPEENKDADCGPNRFSRGWTATHRIGFRGDASKSQCSADR
jgi:hypothetical protein